MSHSLSVAILTYAATTGAVMAGSSQATHELLPVPRQVSWRQHSLPLKPPLTLAVIGPAEERVSRAIARFSDALHRNLGLPAEWNTASPDDALLLVEYAEASKAVQSVDEKESYSLSVSAAAIKLKAQNPLGVLRGLETLLQLPRVARGGVIVPGVEIQDHPRFRWRGLLVDACRHWQPVEVIKRTLDGMASVKMNVLHWHLTEDQAFRIESRRFPSLHEMGSEGQYYTQNDVREIVAYARDRGIRVMPEFDMPGHTTSWLVGHPELGSAPGPYKLGRVWGIYDNCLDPTRDEIYEFIAAFLDEMVDLFPDEYAHIGGDEVTPRHWNGNADIQRFMYGHEIRDSRGLQALFNARVHELLSARGKKMVGWDEILEGFLPKDVTVQSWRGPESLAHAARNGYGVILSHGYYLDHVLPASFHYLVDPLPNDAPLTPAERERVLGGEACMWSEYVSSETIESRIWPRAASVAERLWSSADVRDLDDMYRRLERQSERLTAMGLTHASNYEPMLRRLIDGRDPARLKVLADVVEPIKFLRRHEMRIYTTDTPLERLVDAVRPESAAARVFKRQVDEYLGRGAQPSSDGALRLALERWARNHAALDLVLVQCPAALEIRGLSRDLTRLGELGLEALDLLTRGTAAPHAWTEEAGRELNGIAIPRAEVSLVVVPAVRKLVLAASLLDQLRKLSPEQWSQRLDRELEGGSSLLQSGTSPPSTD